MAIDQMKLSRHRRFSPRGTFAYRKLEEEIDEIEINPSIG
jgi:hypothetical protein